MRFEWLLLAAADAVGVSLEWRRALARCAAEVCEENHVEENATLAARCGGIPVPSLYGGAGRTTLFGRTLWCAAKLGTGLILDLYAGFGDTTALLAHGLQHAPSAPSAPSARAVLSFEQRRERLDFVASRLKDLPVHLAGIEAPRVLSCAQCAVLVAGSTGARAGGGALLEAVCGEIQDLGLLVLDPDVEMHPQEFARDWRTLEKKMPEMVAIYNTNLPGGAGWVLNRLLALQYEVIASGANDGGANEPDELLQLRTWSLVLRKDARPPLQGASSPPQASGFPETVQMSGTQAKEWIEERLQTGWEWGNTTFRAVRGGAVLRVHQSVGAIVPVEVQRPTDELLVPPSPETNGARCFADADPEAPSLRVPCFLSCEGPGFKETWGDFRRKVLQNAKQGLPLDEELLVEAVGVNRGIVESDEILIRGRSRFMARLRHEYTHDEHLEGFCLYGVTAAAFVKGRHMLSMEPQHFEVHGKKYFAPSVGLAEMDTAYTMVTDSNSKGGIEFSFLENSGWAVALEDIIVNLEDQKAQLGRPFGRPSGWPPLEQQPVSGLAKSAASLRLERLAILGVGDHLTATFDAVLMAETSLMDGEDFQVHRDFLGRFCPKHLGQRHQCRQRCALLGDCQAEEGKDPIAEWLDGIIHPESLEELTFDLEERQRRLAEVAQSDARLRDADLIVCSHPTLLCIILAQVSSRPLFTHASSTLLYGLRCPDCVEHHSNLRHFGRSALAQRFLRMASRHLRRGFLAEGRFLAEQIRHQVGLAVPWAPPLALYIAHGSWRGSGGAVRRAVVLRSRFFVSLMGELMRSLLREMVSINFPEHPLEVVFLGQDNQFEEQWLTMQQLASFDAALLWPNDLHQRTFHEIYRMAMPLFMPDSSGLFRAQRMSNWGYASYGAQLAELEPQDRHPFPPWWNSFNVTPEVVTYWERYSDWQMPHVQRFSSLPGLIVQLERLDLHQTSAQMRAYHLELCEATLILISQQILPILA